MNCKENKLIKEGVGEECEIEGKIARNKKKQETWEKVKKYLYW